MLKSFLVCLATVPNSFNTNPRVRFIRESERIQIDASAQSLNQDVYNECFDPTSSPIPDNLDLTMDNDLANSSAASGFDYLPKAPAQSLILKCTNSDQLATTGSCYF